MSKISISIFLRGFFSKKFKVGVVALAAVFLFAVIFPNVLLASSSTLNFNKTFSLSESGFKRTTANIVLAQNGLRIDGELNFSKLYRKSGTNPNMEIQAISGDIVLNGKVIIGKEKRVISPRISELIDSMYAYFAPSVFAQSSKKASKGRSLIITAQQGDIIVGPNLRLQAEKGQNGSGKIIHRQTGDVFEAEAGGDGGDIILRAPNGTVKIAPSTNFVFVLGNGGKGGRIKGSDPALLTEHQELTLIGGDGGNSGKLIIEAKNIEGAPLASQKISMIAGGGGNGGDSLWTIENPEPGTRMSLIKLQGGRGGDSAAAGGDGGSARYNSGKVINSKDATATTNVEVTGGDGGDVFESPIPVPDAVGGNGGDFFVIGNHGFAPYKNSGFVNGMDGGSVAAQGGNGGSILGDLSKFPFSNGGNGAPLRFYGRNNKVVAGNGSKGFSNCEENNYGNGGNGGDGGVATVFAGNGGDGSTGGDGGSIYTVSAGSSGSGGNGIPPGNAGVIGNVNATFGVGGSGDVLGKNGGLKFIGDLPLAGISGKECSDIAPAPEPEPENPVPDSDVRGWKYSYIALSESEGEGGRYTLTYDPTTGLVHHVGNIGGNAVDKYLKPEDVAGPLINGRATCDEKGNIAKPDGGLYFQSGKANFFEPNYLVSCENCGNGNDSYDSYCAMINPRSNVQSWAVFTMRQASPQLYYDKSAVEIQLRGRTADDPEYQRLVKELANLKQQIADQEGTTPYPVCTGDDEPVVSWSAATGLQTSCMRKCKKDEYRKKETNVCTAAPQPPNA